LSAGPVRLCRFGMDPLAMHPNQVDKSPYTFSWNNPIMLIDPDGRCPDCPDPSTAKGGDIVNPNGGMEFIFTNGEWTGIVGTLNEVTITTTKEDVSNLSFVVGVGSASATNVKGAAELTQVEIIADSKRNGRVLNADKEAFKSIGKIAKATKLAGSSLGFISLADHLSDAVQSFEQVGLSSTKGWLKIGKAGAGALLMVARSNPLVLTLSVTYSIADAAGYLE
jgi:hypothetical protein